MVNFIPQRTVEQPDNEFISSMPPLTDAIDAEVDHELTKVVPKQFEITDESSANWLLRRIVTAREYAQHVKEWAAQEQRRAEREERTLLFLFGRQLERWVRAEIEKLNHRRKSICLPAGTLGLRRVNACLQIDDEQAVIGWARKHLPSALLTVEKLSRSVLSDHFKQTGEMPDSGAHLEQEKEAFFIR